MRTYTRGEKVKGCAIGCGALLLFFIFAGVGLYYWLATPGSQVPTDFILGVDSVALMHVEGLSQDPGLRTMLAKLLPEIQEAQWRRAGKEDLPWLARFFLSAGGNMSARDLDKTLRDIPKDFTVTLESIPGRSEPAVAGAINLSRFPRLFRLIFGLLTTFQQAELYRGKRLLELDEGKGGTVTFVEQTLVWAQDSMVLRHVLDQSEAALEAPTSEVLQAYNSRDQRWDLYGVVDNRDQMLRWLLLLWLDRAEIPRSDEKVVAVENGLSLIRRVHFGIDVADDDSVETNLELEYFTATDAEQQLPILEGVLQALQAQGTIRERLELERDIRRTNEFIRIDFAARGIRRAIVRLVDHD